MKKNLLKFSNKGETLVETLVAILVIAIVITGFSAVIAGTIRTNKAISDMRQHNGPDVEKHNVDGLNILINSDSYCDFDDFVGYKEDGLYYFNYD